MNTFSKNNLEEILDCMGAQDVPESIEHRYKLRRMLLNSKYFDAHYAAKRRVMMFVPVVASGFMVVMLFVAVQNNPAVNTDLVQEPTQGAGVYRPDFVTEGLIATFVDDRPLVPATIQANTVQYSTRALAVQIQ